MTLHESIKQKIKDGWTLDRLSQHYGWISEPNLLAVIRSARHNLKLEDDTRRGINLWANP
jgi:hypothetical protein